MDQKQQLQPNRISKRPKVAFTHEEDQTIIHYVNLLGTKKWISIAKFVNGRTAKQCRDRYVNYLKPGLTNIEWTKKEDDVLIELFNKFGPKWAVINKNFKNRNQTSIKNRIFFLQKHSKKTEKIFTKDIDENKNDLLENKNDDDRSLDDSNSKSSDQNPLENLLFNNEDLDEFSDDFFFSNNEIDIDFF